MKKVSITILILFLFLGITHAQFNSFQLFDGELNDELSDNSILLDIDENHLIMLFGNSRSLYSSSDSLFCLHSFDNGSTWLNKQFLSEPGRFSNSKYFEFGAAILNSGGIWIYFKSDSMRTMFSDDSGESWVNGPKIPVTNSLFIIGFSELSESYEMGSFSCSKSKINFISFAQLSSH